MISFAHPTRKTRHVDTPQGLAASGRRKQKGRASLTEAAALFERFAVSDRSIESVTGQVCEKAILQGDRHMSALPQKSDITDLDITDFMSTRAEQLAPPSSFAGGAGPIRSLR